jgi:undecaprenyl-diphosphatase
MRLPRDTAARTAILGSLAFAMVTLPAVLGWTQAMDEAVLRWMAAQGTPLVNEVWVEITTLADTVVVGAVGITLAIALGLGGRGRRGAFILVVAVGAMLIGPALKLLIGRPRPELFEWMATARLSSYPSSHALQAVALWGGVAFALARGPAAAWLRTFLWGAALLLIALIGISRVALGVHYPTDVLGGWAAGATWLGFCMIWLGAPMRRRRRKR